MHKSCCSKFTLNMMTWCKWYLPPPSVTSLPVPAHPRWSLENRDQWYSLKCSRCHERMLMLWETYIYMAPETFAVTSRILSMLFFGLLLHRLNFKTQTDDIRVRKRKPRPITHRMRYHHRQKKKKPWPKHKKLKTEVVFKVVCGLRKDEMFS